MRAWFVLDFSNATSCVCSMHRLGLPGQILTPSFFRLATQAFHELQFNQAIPVHLGTIWKLWDATYCNLRRAIMLVVQLKSDTAHRILETMPQPSKYHGLYYIEFANYKVTRIAIFRACWNKILPASKSIKDCRIIELQWKFDLSAP